MNLPPGMQQIEDRLAGWPDTSLTILLFALAFLIVLIALYGPAVLKAATAAWIIFP